MASLPALKRKNSTQRKIVVMVCGGAGFIGSNFIRYSLKRYPHIIIVCVDALTYAGNRDNLQGLPAKRFSFIKADITDKKAMLRIGLKYAPSHIINFAAESHVDNSIHGGAESFIHTNVMGTTVLLDVARALPGLTQYLQVSTDEVYGALPLTGGKKFTEDSMLLPNSPYAASKAAADLVARAYYKTYGLPVVITRCSNNYGPYQHPEKLIPFSILRLQSDKPIAIYGDGKYVRDWIHVEDHCSALALALFQGVPGETYNIGADDEVSNLVIARELLKFFKKDESSIAYVTDRPGHDRRYAINSSKISKALGWAPKHTLTTSLKPTIEWYVANNTWVRKALKRSGAPNKHLQ